MKKLLSLKSKHFAIEIFDDGVYVAKVDHVLWGPCYKHEGENLGTLIDESEKEVRELIYPLQHQKEATRLFSKARDWTRSV